jgi:hypothetical protein
MKGAFKNDLVQIVGSTNHHLEPTTTIKDGEITLGEVTKISIKDPRMSLTVTDELFLETKQEGAHCGSRHGDVLYEVGVDRATEPWADGAIHLPPVRISCVIGLDVHKYAVRELAPIERVEEEGLPPVVVRGDRLLRKTWSIDMILGTGMAWAWRAVTAALSWDVT